VGERSIVAAMPLALLLSGCGLLLEATPVADAGAPGLDASSPAPEADE